MKIEDHLSKEQKKELNQIGQQKKKQEKVDWIDIMGINRDRYTRKNGAVRRK